MTSSVATAPRAYWGAYAATKAAFEVCWIAMRKRRKHRQAARRRRQSRRDPHRDARPRLSGRRPGHAQGARSGCGAHGCLLGEQFASGHRESVNQSDNATVTNSPHISLIPARLGVQGWSPPHVDAKRPWKSLCDGRAGRSQRTAQPRLHPRFPAPIGLARASRPWSTTCRYPAFPPHRSTGSTPARIVWLTMPGFESMQAKVSGGRRPCRLRFRKASEPDHP
jgi:hypothetical protein